MRNLLIAIILVMGSIGNAMPVRSMLGAKGCVLNSSAATYPLPDGVVPVSYIEAVNKQWINTGIYPNSNMKFEMGFLNQTSKTIAFGCLDSTSRFCFPASSADWFYFGGINNVHMTTSLLSLNVRHDVSMSKAGIFIDGNLLSSIISSAEDRTSTLPLSLNGWVRPNIESYGHLSIYYFKAFQGNNLIAHMIPVCDYRSGTATGGMYDVVRQMFFGNSGTGSFIVGPEI